MFADFSRKKLKISWKDWELRAWFHKSFHNYTNLTVLYWVRAVAAAEAGAAKPASIFRLIVKKCNNRILHILWIKKSVIVRGFNLMELILRCSKSMLSFKQVRISNLKMGKIRKIEFWARCLNFAKRKELFLTKTLMHY